MANDLYQRYHYSFYNMISLTEQLVFPSSHEINDVVDGARNGREGNTDNIIMKIGRCSSAVPRLSPNQEKTGKRRSCHSIDLGQLNIQCVPLNVPENTSKSKKKRLAVLKVEKNQEALTQSRMYPPSIIGKGDKII